MKYLRGCLYLALSTIIVIAASVVALAIVVF